MAITLAYSDEVTMDTTHLQSLTTSGTHGWVSAVVDNTTDGYLDVLVQVTLVWHSAPSFPPAQEHRATIFAYGGLTTTYTNPATGGEGNLVGLPSVQTNFWDMKPIGVVEYPGLAVLTSAQPYSVAAAFGGRMPPKWGLFINNNSGTLLAPSGNVVTWRGVHRTHD